MEFLNHRALESSDVVANSRMNRERVATGVNSYQRELSLDVIEYLQQLLAANGRACWLDLCCGQGNALIEVAAHFAERGEPWPLLQGVDLVGMFSDQASTWAFLDLHSVSLHDWSPATQFDLITCVHGLHYLGDKLDMICRAGRWLKAEGLFVANLDLANLRDENGKSMSRSARRWMRSNGLIWDSRHHLLTCRGQKSIQKPFEYLGAQDTAGANYTGQEAVDSFYGSC